MSVLRGKTALVTGAAKRLGRAIALALAGEGAGCLLHYRHSADDVARTLAECRKRGVPAESVQADLLDLGSVERLGQAALERGADILVHNASMFSRVPFLETSVEAHHETIARDLAIHVTVPYLLARILGQRMVEKGWGRIVVVGDWSSEAAVYPHYAPYIISKSAVPTLVKVLALELGRRCPAVTVNAILPGPIIPPEGHDPADLEMVRRQTIAGEWLGPEEIARSIIFLAASEKITGESLRVDGGRSVKAT